MIPTIAALTGADEFFNHQIVNTFAAVSTPERAWTEKAWFTLMRKDGSLQASFGIGKYANRNIVDGFAGVQIGTRQLTVRASRTLSSAPERIGVGPLGYEVISPLETIRLTLAENAAQPLRFDLTFHATMPGFFENRDLSIHAGRAASDVIRFHQAGTISGWIEIEGERHEVNPDDWFGFRDRSWGIREHVGLDPADLAPGSLSANARNKAGSAFHMNWAVAKLDRPDGTSYDLAWYFRDYGGDGPPDFFSGYINEADGTQTPILHLYPEMDYRASDRAAMRGTITAIVAGRGKSMEERVFEIEAINPEMGFRLLPGMYGEWKGQIHGSYKGEDFLDGETVEDVNAPDKTAGNYRWQIRDRPVRIREGANSGYGDMETIILGDSYPGVRFV